MYNTLGMQIYRWIYDDIMDEKLKPGQKLTEEMLSKRYNVSRTPVREALRTLVNNGLADFIPHSGAVVKVLSPDEIHQLFDLRTCLEGMAARLAAEKRYTEEQLAYLADLNGQLHYSYQNCDLLLSRQLETSFHREIAVLSGNSYLLEDWERNQRMHAFLMTNSIRHRIEGQEENQFDHMINGHEQILHAIMTHNGETAEWAARMHVIEAHNFYLESRTEDENAEDAHMEEINEN